MLEGFLRAKNNAGREKKITIAIQTISNGDTSGQCGRRMVGDQRARVLCRRTHPCQAKGGVVWDKARSLFFSLSQKADRNVHRASLVPANGTVCWDLNSHVCVPTLGGFEARLLSPASRAAAHESCHVEGKSSSNMFSIVPVQI